MDERRIALSVARKFVSGEDWVVTDEIKRLVPQVVREIQRRGGSVSTVGHGRINAIRFPVDEGHLVPLEIQLYEGTHYPGEVLVNAYFSGHRPIPIGERLPFDARAIVDAVSDGFLDLVNFRGASVSRIAGSVYPSMAEVERAELWDLVYWNRYLPGPGSAAMGKPTFEAELNKEAKIIRRIMDRIKELGGITPEISKGVGWNRMGSSDAQIEPGLNEELDLLGYKPHKMWTASLWVPFRKGCEVDIANEVISKGRSRGWHLPTDPDSWVYRQALEFAKAAERTLARFNIGYLDDRGEWSWEPGGSTFFQNMNTV